MEDSEILQQLLLDWELHRSDPDAPTPETLCRNHPEFLTSLKDCIRRLEEADSLLSLDDAENPDATPRPSKEQLPTIPGYDIVRLLGVGGMGKVYLAQHRGFDRQVVIKLLRPQGFFQSEQFQRFQREMRVLFDLKHDRIVRIYDAKCEGRQPYYTMDYLDKGNLRSHLKDFRGQAEKSARFVEQVARAVHHAHERQILHRDLKPDNILIDASGQPVVSDFGLAKLMDVATEIDHAEKHNNGRHPDPYRTFEARTLTYISQDRAIMGTLAYMAPEQLSADYDAIDRQTDVWALGVIFYELLHGKHPFLDGDLDKIPFEIIRQRICEVPLAFPEEAGDEQTAKLNRIIARCLEKAPEDRYATAEQLADELRRCLEPEPIPAAESAPPPPWRWTFQRGVVLAGVLFAVIATGWFASGWFKPVAELQTVRIVTEPPGAEIVLVPIRKPLGNYDEKAAIRPKEKSPVIIKDVPPGQYLVVANIPEHGFHEVLRIVPSADSGPQSSPSEPTHRQWKTSAEGAVQLATIRIPDRKVTDGMAYFPGGTFKMGSKKTYGMPPHDHTIAPFYLDCTEMTVGEFKKLRMEHRKQQYGIEGPLLETQILPRAYYEWLVDEHGKPRYQEDEPIRYVRWDVAVSIAEQAGKRLPDEAEYEFAATNGGKQKYPWGDNEGPVASWYFGPVKQFAVDATNTDPKVYGLFSNVGEWTGSMNSSTSKMLTEEQKQQHENSYVVRGVPESVAVDEGLRLVRWKADFIDPRARQGFLRTDQRPGVGFRCARSAKPRFLK